VTNVLARKVGLWADERALTPLEQIRPLVKTILPKAADGLPATYDDDALQGYQQTAALLTVFPLEYFNADVAEKLFDRYADLTSEVGPAMSESIHATIAARLGREDAYERWQRSWRTYTDGAMMFHERRLKDDGYFMTGAAGCLQTVLYGFAGMRFMPVPDCPPGLPAHGLDDLAIVFKPSLPREWKRLTLKNFWLGKDRATITIDAGGARIEVLETNAEDGVPRRGP
jgi:trehalose/maltose hydrolase-like predicted phosphorylase